MYNSAGEFSTFVENFLRGGRLFGRVVGGLRPPPPLSGLRRGLRPLLGPGKEDFVGPWQRGRRSFLPGRACQRYNGSILFYEYKNLECFQPELRTTLTTGVLISEISVARDSVIVTTPAENKKVVFPSP